MLLVSLCTNETDSQPTLLTVDPVSWAITPFLSPPGSGATGICRIGDDVFVASQSVAAAFTVIDARTMRVRAEAPMPGANDVHSIAAWEDGLAVASTGTDEVLWYRYDGDGFVDRTVLWAAGSERSDTVHVNGLAAHGGKLVCCAFGPGFRDFDVWSESQDGYVYDIVNARFVLRGLARPHTVAFLDGGLFLCESSRMNFRSLERAIAHVEGFTRGVAPLPDGRVVVGSSRVRIRSRSTGVYLDPETIGRYPGSCALHVIDLDGTVHETISLADYGREVYDIFPLS
jgi:hypothetical protein